MSTSYRPNFVAHPPTSYTLNNFSASPPSSYNSFAQGVSDQFNSNMVTPSAQFNNSLGPLSFASSLGSGFNFSSLLGPLGGAVGGIASGLLGYFSQREANKAMLESTRLTNEQNYKIWQEQQLHNKEMFQMENRANIDMWERNNEYNSPTAQVERLRDAGLNAGILMNGGNASGVSSSPASSAHAQPATAPTMQGPPAEAFQNPTLMGLQQGLQSLIGLSSALNQSQSMDMSKQLLPYTLKGFEHDYKSKVIMNKSMKFDLASKEAFFETQYMQQQMILDNMRAQNAILHLDLKQKNLFLQYYPSQLLDEMALRSAQIVAYADSHNLSAKQIDEIISRIAKTYSDIAVNNSNIAVNNQNIEESKSRTAVNYATVDNLNASTAQTWQGINQSAELFPHIKQGQINNNLDTYWRYRNGNVQYQVAFGTMNSMIESIRAQSGFNQSYFGVEKVLYDDIRSYIGNGDGFNLWRSAGSLGRYTGDNFPVKLGFNFGGK